jgi:hypothetical protein
MSGRPALDPSVARTRWPVRLRRNAFRTVVLVSVSLLVAPTTGARPAAADKSRTLSAPAVPAVQGSPAQYRSRPADLSQGATSAPTAAVTWPAPGSVETDLTPPARSLDDVRNGSVTPAGPVRAGSLPVWVSPAADPHAPAVSRMRIRVLDRAGLPAVWRNGVVLEVGRADKSSVDGRATVSVDYQPFATAFGADWATRLRLVSLPGCALTTPDAAGCRATPLPSRNDPLLRRVSADVAVPASGTTMLALTAGPSGGAGDFTVSSLAASSTWTAGGSAGTFTWGYPLRTPPSTAGPAPQVSLAYSSAAVDGRSRATNNQPSWVGEGFEWWPGSIERRYKACAEDAGGGANNPAGTGDLCWGPTTPPCP